MKLSGKILLMLAMTLLLLGCRARKTEIGEIHSVSVMERVAVVSDTAECKAIERDTMVGLSDSRTQTSERGEISISRDTAGQPVRIVWHRSGDSSRQEANTTTGDRWFAGLNATRQSEAVKMKADLNEKSETKSVEPESHFWAVSLIPLSLILIFIVFALLWLGARKGAEE